MTKKGTEQIHGGITNSGFVSPNERQISPGLSHVQPDRPVGEQRTLVYPGRIVVGPIDTTRQTLK